MTDRINGRLALLLAIVAVLLVTLVGWFLLVSPQRSKASALDGQIGDANIKLAATRTLGPDLSRPSRRHFGYPGAVALKDRMLAGPHGIGRASCAGCPRRLEGSQLRPFQLEAPFRYHALEAARAPGILPHLAPCAPCITEAHDSPLAVTRHEENGPSSSGANRCVESSESAL